MVSGSGSGSGVTQGNKGPGEISGTTVIVTGISNKGVEREGEKTLTVSGSGITQGNKGPGELSGITVIVTGISNKGVEREGEETLTFFKGEVPSVRS